MELAPEDYGPDLPALASFILEHFEHLNRRGGDMGLRPINWHDLRAYQKETRFKLTVWEKFLILDVDDCFRKHYHESYANPVKPEHKDIGRKKGDNSHLPPHLMAYLRANQIKAEAEAKKRAEEAGITIEATPEVDG